MKPPEKKPDPERDTARNTTGGMLDSAIAAVRAKIQDLVDSFAKGEINRKQFHTLYERYQRRINALTEFQQHPRRLDTREAEDTVSLRARLTARVSGLSIYSNKSGLPIETLGKFNVDPALLIPMLSSYRSVAAEAFKAGIRSTAMEDDQWLCFVPGQVTTLVALFTAEPSAAQLQNTEAMHRDFERANARALTADPIDPTELAYPFISFLQKAFREK